MTYTEENRRIEDYDVAAPLEIRAHSFDLDQPDLEHEPPIVLTGADVTLFLTWAASESWRCSFEEGLQVVCNDFAGRPQLSTTVPLVTFRHYFCSGGRVIQSEATATLMACLFEATHSWKAKGYDMVTISGAFRPQATTGSNTLDEGDFYKNVMDGIRLSRLPASKLPRA